MNKKFQDMCVVFAAKCQFIVVYPLQACLGEVDQKVCLGKV
jgi:hypothetical protein